MKLWLVAALGLLCTPAFAETAADVPSKFNIPWGNSAGASYLRVIPQASQIGIQNCAASLTDGFPPLTFVPASAGGCPPFGADMNGILKQITQWARWQALGTIPPWDTAFSTAVGGYPKGALIPSATTANQYWYNTIDNNLSNPDAAGAGWQSVLVGNSGATAGTYTRPKTTVTSDGKISAIASGAAPTRSVICSQGGPPTCTIVGNSGNYTAPAGAVRLFVREVGGGGGGGSNSGNGNAGATTSFDGITALGGKGGAQSVGSGGAAAGGATSGNGTGSGTGITVMLRMASSGGGYSNGGNSINSVAGHGSTSPFGGGGMIGQNAGFNSGSGGSGANSATTGLTAGGGGSAGEYVELQILNPGSVAIPWLAGAPGNPGSGAGLAGGGQIVIDEYYD